MTLWRDGVDAWTRGRVDAWTRGRVDAWTRGRRLQPPVTSGRSEPTFSRRTTGQHKSFAHSLFEASRSQL